MPARPNIILCICDQLRAFEVGCYGNPVIRTPNYLYALPLNGDRSPGDAPQHFYAMADDPYQLNNLADRAAEYPVTRELDARLRAWHAATPWMGRPDAA